MRIFLKKAWLLPFKILLATLIGFTSCASSGTTSTESQLTMGILKLIDIKGSALPRVKAGKSYVDPSSTQPSPDAEFAKKHKVVVTQTDGYPTYAISPQGNSAGKTILYLHGGAYSVSFVADHWKFMGYLADQTGHTVMAPDYPLPPEADWVKSWAMVEKLYDEISKENGNAGIIMMGDSAGGGFALAFAQMLAQDGKRQPERLILLSPWLDITLSNPGIPAIADADPFLNVEALRICGTRWAGGTDTHDWRLSPINGSFDNLPPVAVFTGTTDVLNPDAKKLRDFFTDRGFPIKYFEYQGMMHVWMLFDFPESMKARAEIIELIKD